MAELLVELFSEEIPARMQKRAAEDFLKLLTDKLAKAELSFGETVAHVTPRRLVAVVRDLAERGPDVKEERRGPRADAPEQALKGFLGSVGLTLDQVERRETPKGTFLFAVIERQGVEARTALPEMIHEAIREIPWPKSMRWARNTTRYVRPLHGVLAILDGETLSGDFDAGDWKLDFSSQTHGHRFLAPDAITVSSFDDYVAKLRDAFVVVDREERKAIIRREADRLAAAEGLSLKDDPGLLEEVCGLVEWPVPLLGTIDNAFMDVPAEVLVTSMRTHQKYFALERADGSLANRFVVVSNMASAPTRDANIVAGNEKVLRARLSDAKFFWDQDRARPLESLLPRLDTVTFYDKLGSVGDKVSRIETLARTLATDIPGCDPDLAARAARLAKADLVTGMVGEFPELQGVMGRYYARGREDEAVADAIAEHYAPQGPGDACPTAPVSVAVALADKIDTLVGFFAIDEKPTGSRDPFALRRAALGVIRLVIENRLSLPLGRAFEAARTGYGDLPAPDGLLAFFADRLKVHLREEGVRHDLISAVFDLGDEDDLVRLVARVTALQSFLATDGGGNLLTAYRRAANILRIEEKKDDRRYDGAIEVALLTEQAEKDLHTALESVGGVIGGLVSSGAFEEAMTHFASLRDPVDAFFETVTVNSKKLDLRANRLKSLSSLVSVMNQVADFSKVEG